MDNNPKVLYPLNMTKILPAILMTFALTLLPLRAAFAQDDSGGALPPKAKAFLMVSAYGAGSGAILGLASMAFGTSSRAIAQGASLGLYTGLIFGTYIIISHNNRTAQPSYDNSTPYQDGEDDYGDYGDEGGEKPAKGGGGGFFDSGIRNPRSGAQVAIHEVNAYRGFETKKGSTSVPPLQMTLFNYTF